MVAVVAQGTYWALHRVGEPPWDPKASAQMPALWPSLHTEERARWLAEFFTKKGTPYTTTKVTVT